MPLSIRLDSSIEVKEEKDEFIKAMARYEEMAKSDKRTGLKLVGKHTWQEVMEEVEKAQAVYESKSQGNHVLKIVRRCFRRFSKSSRSFKSWLEVLPEGDYSSIICGGFKMIFIVCRTKL